MIKTQWNEEFYKPVVLPPNLTEVESKVMKAMRRGYVTTPALSKLLGRNYATVRQHLHSLRDKGLITCTSSLGKTAAMWSET